VARFADETSTGRLLRGLGTRPKATVAARAESADDFAWFTAWRHDFCRQQGLTEIKTPTVLQITATNKEARNRLHQGIAPCPIFVIDIAHSIESRFAALRRLAPGLLTEDEDFASLPGDPEILQLARGLLIRTRDAAIEGSAIGAIEALMTADASLSASLAAAGLGPFLPLPGRAFDRNVLRQMHTKEFDETVARFAVALADALSPGEHARITTKHLADHRYLTAGHVAYRVLGATVSHDYLFDVAGSARVTRGLEDAHGQVVTFLNEQSWRYRGPTLRPGRLLEDDSKHVLGIQVADIAAGVAAEKLEQAEGTRGDAARSLLGLFSRVFLNRAWLT
jgi:hypothetical protein